MTGPHLAEWQLFSSRYGLNDREDCAEFGDWRRRHKMPRDEPYSSTEAIPSLFWCRCPGPSLATSPCGLKLTQEDGLCDECRQWCVCIDSEKNYHLIADVGAL